MKRLPMQSLHQMIAIFVLVLLMQAQLLAQTEPPIGIRQNTPTVHAFTNAKIITAPGKVIDKGTLVIRDGMIIAVGDNVTIPADARVWDASRMTLYPGLIESYSDIGVPKKPERGQGQDQPQGQQQQQPEVRGSKYWNGNVLAAQNADELFNPDPKAMEKLRGMGFTTALVVPQKGIFRGTSSLVNLGDGKTNELIVKSRIAQHLSFESSQGEEYPNSLMGAIALMRQTFFDAQWHRDAWAAAAKYPNEPRPEFTNDLAALEDVISAKQPVMFEAGDELATLRAQNIAKEFSLQLMVRGNGYEYRRLDAVKQTGAPIILPLNFPETPSVQTPEEALNVSLQELRHWDEAAENPKRLQEAGVQIALTTSTLKDIGNFPTNLRKAIERGLSADAALAALTTTPAKLFGVEKKVGTLEVGKMANFVITDGELFNEKTKIRETWIDGKRFEIKPKTEYDVRGTWEVTSKELKIDSLTFVLKGEVDKPSGSAKAKGKDAKFSNISFSDMKLAVSFASDSLGAKGIVRMTGVASGEWLMGTGELADGQPFKWTANRKEQFKQEPDTSKPKPPQMSSFSPVYPYGEFGRATLPQQVDKLLVRGATIWTSGPQGNLENADLYIEKGKIKQVGQNLTAPADATVINAQGKHVTAGLIDAHSHSAAAGSVNETGQAITAEVRIGDIIDSDDIGIYRELAGGLTAANVLHGSANPIGGQNQVIKLRWGALPEEMKFEGAIPGIKFALGENVKQSNWGERYTTRYPQTRQGVEQIIRDEFQAARDYKKIRDEFKSGARKIPPRRDIQTETLLEILEGKRLVHSHSYRQDEILMLVRVAEDFGFQIGTFQHVLEGYKVAEALAKHGAGASMFSDWWAYKMEVIDAIPYCGALMHDAGVVVSFNSDSDEQARRMNTEAAKAVKYGGVPPQDALKFVTLNPAKQLRIDNRVGSLEVGKDADFVIWSGDPLSTYSMCEQTWIDGRKYFDRDEDNMMRVENQKQRATLVQKILSAKSDGGGSGGGPSGPPRWYKERYSCQDEIEGKESK
ncbi:MAG: amidohydrolase family protein [Ignavibacteriae bacterium]|nr:amidohydrolase family protein [Ignavibacteriota bacterium]